MPSTRSRAGCGRTGLSRASSSQWLTASAPWSSDRRWSPARTSRSSTDLLDTDEPLTDEQVARVKRAIASLNTLGSVLTRTRKVDVPDAKAVRVAEQIDVDWTDAGA